MSYLDWIEDAFRIADCVAFWVSTTKLRKSRATPYTARPSIFDRAFLETIANPEERVGVVLELSEERGIRTEQDVRPPPRAMASASVQL